MPTPAEQLTGAWRRLSRLPGGGWLLGRLVGRIAPYSGSIRPRVLSLEPGRAVVVIRDRRRLRNHLRSVHALALANLAELASGLAMITALPPHVRGIPVRLEIDYLKKARGRLTATGQASPPQTVTEPTTALATADLRDESGDPIAQATITWHLSPTP